MGESEVPRVGDAGRSLERAGIRASATDTALLESFLARLRPLPAPARESDPWVLPKTTRWPGA